MLTRCPHCQARFKVTEVQLSAAGGKVRCGNCMQVFNAREHLMPAPATRPAVRTGSAAPRVAATSTKAQDDNRTVVRPSAARSAGAPQGGQPARPTTPAQPSPPKDRPAPVAPPADPLTAALHEASENSDDEDLDDLIFQDNPEEDKEEEGYSGNALVNETDLSEELRALDAGGKRPVESFIEEVEGEDDTDASGSDDESWAEEMLRELEGTPTGKPRVDPRAPQPIMTAEDLEVAPAEPPATFNRAEAPAQARHVEPPPVSPLSEDALMQLRHAHLQEDEDEVAGRQWIWGLGALLLVLTLLAQLAWLHFDRLARFDQLRPIYAQACNLIGCELPPLLDLKQIHNRNLAVRNHPTVQNALIVDAIIINNASFDQPFPNISLAFKDINDRVIAYRVFSPEEYLAGEALDMKAMPSRTPIHIALEILHPGKQAVNYELNFHPATYNAPASG
ncbi:MAG: DUF3426 domain-containing protein [Gammaproteobacteria bacterium]|nr:MAG: DUF3426 domain-containing protein [Gammaproteobacteria bacterium]